MEVREERLIFREKSNLDKLLLLVSNQKNKNFHAVKLFVLERGGKEGKPTFHAGGEGDFIKIIQKHMKIH